LSTEACQLHGHSGLTPNERIAGNSWEQIDTTLSDNKTQFYQAIVLTSRWP
jgi:hypothetical protein